MTRTKENNLYIQLFKPAIAVCLLSLVVVGMWKIFGISGTFWKEELLWIAGILTWICVCGGMVYVWSTQFSKFIQKDAVHSPDSLYALLISAAFFAALSAAVWLADLCLLNTELCLLMVHNQAKLLSLPDVVYVLLVLVSVWLFVFFLMMAAGAGIVSARKHPEHPRLHFVLTLLLFLAAWQVSCIVLAVLSAMLYGGRDVLFVQNATLTWIRTLAAGSPGLLALFSAASLWLLERACRKR